MSDARLVGVRPWFPWPLSRWGWWTEPVPAERVAALRIATALVLLVDIAFGYLPHFAAFFAPKFSPNAFTKVDSAPTTASGRRCTGSRRRG